MSAFNSQFSTGSDENISESAHRGVESPLTTKKGLTIRILMVKQRNEALRTVLRREFQIVPELLQDQQLRDAGLCSPDPLGIP